MIKRLLTLVLALIPMLGFSQHRSESDAITIAKEFWDTEGECSNLSIVSQNSISKANARLYRAVDTTFDSGRSFYVVNDEKNHRFVIVSADERMYKILGYSDNGCFDSETVPPGLMDLLNGYDKEYANVDLAQVQLDSEEISQEQTSPIEPLIKTHWGQGYPYNLECPIIDGKRCDTGCGATALAQVLNFYRYSQNGVGSHSYATRTNQIPLNINFENLDIDWSKLVNDYNEFSSEEERMEVAKLMYASGVSLSMDYKYGASSIQPNGMAYSLKHFWGYNPNTTYIMRNYKYNLQDIQEIITTELELGHPVFVDLYTSEDAGHEAIIDGIDKNQLLHYNFGWEGYADGYYRLKSLIAAAICFNSADYTVNICVEQYGEKTYDFVLGKGEMSDLPSSVNIGDSIHFDTSINCVSTDVPKSYMNISEGLYAEVGVGLFDSQFRHIHSFDKDAATFLSDLYINYQINIAIDSDLFTEGQFYLAPYYTLDKVTYNVPTAELDRPELYSVSVRDHVVFFIPTRFEDLSTSIGEVKSDCLPNDVNLIIKTRPKGFDITSKEDTILQIFNVSGQVVISGPLEANSQRTVFLRKGIYLINGIKYVLQ